MGNDFICVDSRPIGGLVNHVVNDVLLEVVARVLEELGVGHAAGTFILDGQRYGSEARCLLRFILSSNCFGLSHFFWKVGHTCTEVAEASIDDILEIGDKPMQYFGEDELLQKAQAGSMVQSRIYQNNLWRVLVLNASYGRFLCSVCLGDGANYDGKIVATSILHAVATALGLMGREDLTLMESFCVVNAPTGLGDTEANRQHRRVINLVKAMFEIGDNEVIQKWQAWHQEAEATGKRKLFFNDY